MKVLIEMTPEHYELFVAECDITSREYTILKNSVVTGQPYARENRMVWILCDRDEAKLLLDTAARVYPEVVATIKDALDLSRE